MDLSLFYFADAPADPTGARNRYRLLIEGAKFADRNGFSAVWTPERHFHEFGGPYPNPSVTSAALAMLTERIALRAGSVVAPLHHPLRIAEEWSVVDNLSAGRVGLSLASGWNPVDFALRPEAYADRQGSLEAAAHSVRSLWRGETLDVTDGAGNPAQVRIFPPPIQPELPLWITSSGNPRTFELAGRLGVGVLTHLLGQSFDSLAANIARYRAALRERPDHDGWAGHVTLMMHTFLGTDADQVRELVREPFTAYLKSSFRLYAAAAPGILAGFDINEVRDSDVDFLVRRSFETLYQANGLFGTVDQAEAVAKQAVGAGVDELACLIDFGVPDLAVLDGLEYLAELGVRLR